MTRKWLRWMPAVAVPAAIAAAVLAVSVPARAGDPLPVKTPEQVLAMVAQHNAKSLSGTLEQTSRLGLPELPATGPASGPDGTSIVELLTGTHTARVFLDGATKVRVQMMDQLAERDAIRNGSELWFYTSRDNTAIHATLPVSPADDTVLPDAMPGVASSPEELAGRILDWIDPWTDVSVGPEVEVAGRAAYNLVLAPRTQATLVGSVAIAVDGQTGLPLSVEIDARAQTEPALKIAFTSLTLEAPDASLFTFSPPPGATVEELGKPAPAPSPDAPRTPPAPDGGTPHAPDGGTSGTPGTPEKGAPAPDGSMPGALPGTWPTETGTRPTVTGTGWETVIGLPARGDSATGESMLNDPLLQQAAQSVPGGRLVSTALVNVLFTDDGRIFVGMVPLERLQAAASAAPSTR